METLKIIFAVLFFGFVLLMIGLACIDFAEPEYDDRFDDEFYREEAEHRARRLAESDSDAV